MTEESIGEEALAEVQHAVNSLGIQPSELHALAHEFGKLRTLQALAEIGRILRRPDGLDTLQEKGVVREVGGRVIYDIAKMVPRGLN